MFCSDSDETVCFVSILPADLWETLCSCSSLKPIAAGSELEGLHEGLGNLPCLVAPWPQTASVEGMGCPVLLADFHGEPREVPALCLRTNISQQSRVRQAGRQFQPQPYRERKGGSELNTLP